MQVRYRKQCRAGSIYRSRRSSVDTDSQYKIQFKQNREGNQQFKRRDSFCRTMTVSSNNTRSMSQKQGKIDGHKNVRKTMQGLKQAVNRKIQLNSEYLKDRNHLKKTIACEMKDYNLKQNVKSKKLEMFEENYRNILTNYQKKKKQLNQNLGIVKSIDNPLSNHQKLPVTYKDNPLNYTYKNNIFNKLNKNIGNSKSKDKNKFQDFYESIDKQINYQQQLRAMKVLISIHQKKQEIYSQLALHHGIKKQSLKIVSEEYDPFQQPKQSIKETDKIILQYVLRRNICEQNWDKNVKNNWKQTHLREIFQKINFNGDHEISLKDLVREINCETSNNYRLRDLYQIYVRLTPLTIDNFIRRLSFKNS